MKYSLYNADQLYDHDSTFCRYYFLFLIGYEYKITFFLVLHDRSLGLVSVLRSTKGFETGIPVSNAFQYQKSDGVQMGRNAFETGIPVSKFMGLSA